MSMKATSKLKVPTVHNIFTMHSTGTEDIFLSTVVIMIIYFIAICKIVFSQVNINDPPFWAVLFSTLLCKLLTDNLQNSQFPW
jgi:uncharacterized protein (DUF983 family)